MQDVRLQLAGRLNLKGKDAVSGYFGNYARLQGLHAEPAVIEGAPGLWIREEGAAQAAYPIVLEWHDGQLGSIRDFRYARYVNDALRGG